MSAAAPVFHPRLRSRRLLGAAFQALCATAALLTLACLALLLIQVASQGWRWLSWRFLRESPSFLDPESGGVASALWGTVGLMVITAVVAVPVGVGAAIYLEEFAPRTRLTRFIHINIANLAGVPSIVYGILGLTIFVRWLHLGRSLLAGALTLSLLVLPVVIIVSREAISAVPDSLRQAAFALGATRWQTVRAHVLPAALPGILTGVILALSRAIGEAAPLLLIGAAAYVSSLPRHPLDSFSALPVLIFQWAMEADPVFHHLSATAIIVLLALLLTMNAAAIAIRGWHQRARRP